MKKRWIALALCLMISKGVAQSMPLTEYQPGQMIDAGLSDPVTFLIQFIGSII